MLVLFDVILVYVGVMLMLFNVIVM